MNWSRMPFTERFNAVVSVYGLVNSDCADEELRYLWEQIQQRGLADAYIAHLTAVLGITGVYTPTDIMRMMTASDEEAHWIAALRAAGIAVETL